MTLFVIYGGPYDCEIVEVPKGEDVSKWHVMTPTAAFSRWEDAVSYCKTVWGCDPEEGLI
jgi:hypothetical protein